MKLKPLPIRFQPLLKLTLVLRTWVVVVVGLVVEEPEPAETDKY